MRRKTTTHQGEVNQSCGARHSRAATAARLPVVRAVGTETLFQRRARTTDVDTAPAGRSVLAAQFRQWQWQQYGRHYGRTVRSQAPNSSPVRACSLIACSTCATSAASVLSKMLACDTSTQPTCNAASASMARSAIPLRQARSARFDAVASGPDKRIEHWRRCRSNR